MARAPRKDVFDPQVVGVYHCHNRCVRQCFLLGDDALTGNNFDHRKQWFVDRFELLARCFAIDLLTYAVMDNHFHVVLRNRPDVLATWSDQEVARRWLRLCPVRKTAEGEAEEPSEAEIAALVSVPEEIAKCRARLGDISWYMKELDEGIAKQANREEGKAGRFWQDRFGCVRLCDEAAILACRGRSGRSGRSPYLGGDCVARRTIVAGQREAPRATHQADDLAPIYRQL